MKSPTFVSAFGIAITQKKTCRNIVRKFESFEKFSRFTVRQVKQKGKIFNLLKYTEANKKMRNVKNASSRIKREYFHKTFSQSFLTILVRPQSFCELRVDFKTYFEIYKMIRKKNYNFVFLISVAFVLLRRH